MTYENLKIIDDNGILIVTLDRERAMNALNGQTMSELKVLFTEDAPKREAIKGIILTGAGERAFVAGADIKEFLALDSEKARNMSKYGHDIFFAIERFDKPVIAAVNGFALGAGCELAMSCHLRIAGEKARFGQPEVNLGIIPGYGGTQRLIQLIGKGKAIELLMTADMLKADEALRLGLVNHVVPAGEEIAKAKEIIEKIAEKAPIAISKIIDCVNAYFEDGVDGYSMEVAEFGAAAASEDFKEGAGAFIEKRAANFKGK